MAIQFDQLAVLKDFRDTDFAAPSVGNDFFGRCGIGNTVEESNWPFERFCCYEEVLRLCQNYDAEKYRGMHKGTPFYFMSWLCFDMRSYEKALFYIDAAVSEDIRAEKGGPNPDRWMDAPAARFLTLEVGLNVGKQVAGRTIEKITELLEAEFGRFNRISAKPPMDLDRWRVFVQPLLAEPSGNQRGKRTIVSALYVFMLEFRDRIEELEFRRGSLGGSNQPFTVHLFTGGLLFESLLKHFYPPRGTPDSRRMEKCLTDNRVKSHFGINQIKCGDATSLAAILTVARKGASVETAFEVAGKLRNTTGHNLVWDNVFDDPESYRTLYEQVMNALLFVIEKNTVVPPITTSVVKVTSITTTASTAIAQTAPPSDSTDAFTSTKSSDDVTVTIPARPHS